MATDVRVQDELRAAVLRGEFAPRQRLVEVELCEQFDASRFAVRAALLALESEGLVERQPNRGARIREISLDEAIEISEIRRVVEGLVAARAAELVDDDAAERLQEIGRQMHAALAAGEPTVYSDLNATLHQSLRDIAGHDTANRIIAQLHGQMVRHQFALSRVPGRTAVSIQQHQRIIDTVCARDPAAAEAAMRDHISSVIEALRTLA
ncbi:GntR family transcriptional regulator [Isoptericola aurantiacus]|uniref:GntR family transcriptional regulator n=1 Tax=Isoptericola aurantiacus TaxID=3377839 RepID=UPI00383BB596